MESGSVAVITFEEICKLDSLVSAIYEEAKAFRVLFEDGRAGRTFSTERAAKLRPDPNFCRLQLWYACARECGDFGLKQQLMQCVGWGARVPELRSSEAYDVAYRTICDAMPSCQHEGSCYGDYPVSELDERQKAGIAAGTLTVLKREQDTGIYSLVESLAHAGGSGPKPTPVQIYPPAPDEKEPVFVVRTLGEAVALRGELEFNKRLKERKISQHYWQTAVYLLDKETREVLLSADLTKANITGPISWRPVVLTFADAELERKLAQICVQVVTVLPKADKPAGIGLMRLEDVHAALKPLAPDVELGIQDMPEAVLDGWLGELCRTRMAGFPRAYAWPALLTAASVLVPHDSAMRTNIYCALVGGKGTGKSSAFEYAFRLLSVEKPTLLSVNAGSAEGLLDLISKDENPHGPRLLFVDELSHLLTKATIEGSTFPQVLSTLYYNDEYTATVARRKRIDFNSRLTLSGGIVEDAFGELFGAATEQGFYDRFLFGQCPSGFSYQWRPFEGSPAFFKTEEDESLYSRVLSTVSVEGAVWSEQTRWANELGIPRRVSEHPLRCAVICASFDGRETLRVQHLGPALALAQYQNKSRKMLAPNPGKNTDAIVGFVGLAYLRARAPQGEWVNRKKMLHSTRLVEKYGPSAVDHALLTLEANGEIEQSKIGRQKVLRLCLDRI